MSASSQGFEQGKVWDSAEEICSYLAASFIIRSFLRATFPFAEGLLRFLLSPLISAAYLGTLTHLHSADGGDV